MKRDERMRDRLLDVAQELVQRVGANAMSYQDLSQALGITKASIHYHYPTKADLLERLVRRYSDSFLGTVDRILASDADGMAKLRRYCALFEATAADGASEKACPMGMLGAEVETLGEQTIERIRAFHEGNRRRLQAILEAGRRDGSLRVDGDAEAAASLIFASLEGGLMTARVHGGVADFRSMVEQLLRLFAP